MKTIELPRRHRAFGPDGGRKGMAALALAVAQAEGIRQAYHTTIPNPARELEIEQAYKLAARRAYEPLTRLMFLDGADIRATSP